jgi:hypothetical protein
MTSLLRRVGFPRAAFVLAALVIGGVVLIGPTGATAGPAFSTTTPFMFSGMNPCTGESIAGNGNLHFLLTENLSASGNNQVHLDVTISGLQAMTTLPFPPKKYVVVDEEGLTDTFDSDGAPSQHTFEVTFQLIRSGEDGSLVLEDDFYVRFLAHITANANGTITVDNFTVEETCK